MHVLCYMLINQTSVEQGKPFGCPFRFAIMVGLCNMLSYGSIGRGTRIN